MRHFRHPSICIFTQLNAKVWQRSLQCSREKLNTTQPIHATQGTIFTCRSVPTSPDVLASPSQNLSKPLAHLFACEWSARWQSETKTSLCPFRQIKTAIIKIRFTSTEGMLKTVTEPKNLPNCFVRSLFYFWGLLFKLNLNLLTKGFIVGKICWLMVILILILIDVISIIKWAWWWWWWKWQWWWWWW